MKTWWIYLVVAAVFLFGVSLSPTGATDLLPGDLIVSDFNGAFGGYGGTSPPGSGLIIKVDPVTGDQTVISSGVNLDAPWSLALDGAGDIIVADRPYTTGWDAEVIRVNLADGAQQVISSANLLTEPRGVCVDAAGDILVSDAALDGTGGILRIDPITGAQTVVSSGGFFNGVAGLAIDAAGDIYATTSDGVSGNLVVLRIDPTSGAQTVVSSGTSSAWFSDIVTPATGEIYVSEVYYDNGIIEVDADTGAQTILSSGGHFQDPNGLDIDLAGDIIAADGNWWWEGRVISVDPATGDQTLLSSGGLLVDPSDVAVFVSPPVNPEADVKANGSDDPIIIASTESLVVDVSLLAGDAAVIPCDMWLVADTPMGRFFYHAGSGDWVPGADVTYQGTLFDLSAFNVLDISGLPPGFYAFYFGVDTAMNGVLDFDLYYDAVEVAVLP